MIDPFWAPKSTGINVSCADSNSTRTCLHEPQGLRSESSEILSLEIAINKMSWFGYFDFAANKATLSAQSPEGYAIFSWLDPITVRPLLN